jgi:hypothetical protein
MYLDKNSMKGPMILLEPLICSECKDVYIQKSTDEIKDGRCLACRRIHAIKLERNNSTT